MEFISCSHEITAEHWLVLLHVVYGLIQHSISNINIYLGCSCESNQSPEKHSYEVYGPQL